MKTLYSTSVLSKGGRTGFSQSSDNRLNVALSTPKSLGGDDGSGTNPEQLFAAGYSACFIGAIKFVAGEEKLSLPSEPVVTAEVGIGKNPKGIGFSLSVELKIELANLETSVANDLINKAHQVCPYSNATRSNINVILSLV
jgi:Ohr subfamily peroxiredoxin